MPRSKKVRYMKMGKADVTLHLQRRGARVELGVVLPKELSEILAQRLQKRVGKKKAASKP